MGPKRAEIFKRTHLAMKPHIDKKHFASDDDKQHPEDRRDDRASSTLYAKDAKHIFKATRFSQSFIRESQKNKEFFQTMKLPKLEDSFDGSVHFGSASDKRNSEQKKSN